MTFPRDRFQNSAFLFIVDKMPACLLHYPVPSKSSCFIIEENIMRALKTLLLTCAVLFVTVTIAWPGTSLRALAQPGSPLTDESKDLFKPPPEGATVLFNGKDLSGWTAMEGKPAPWKVEDNYMEVAPHKGNIRTKETFGPDFELH